MNVCCQQAVAYLVGFTKRSQVSHMLQNLGFLNIIPLNDKAKWYITLFNPQRHVTSELHHFLVESQLIGMERKLIAANITSMKKLLDTDEEEFGAYGITPSMVHRMTLKLKKYITKHPEAEYDESNRGKHYYCNHICLNYSNRTVTVSCIVR